MAPNKALTRAQILDVVGRWDYSIGKTKVAKVLSLRVVIEQVKTSNQQISAKYAEKIFDIYGQCRSQFMWADVSAYLSLVTDSDMEAGRFPPFERDRVRFVADQMVADQTPVSRAPVPSAPRARPTPKNQPNTRFSDLPSGHQTLLGLGNIVGNGISIVFFVIVIALVFAAVKSIFE